MFPFFFFFFFFFFSFLFFSFLFFWFVYFILFYFILIFIEDGVFSPGYDRRQALEEWLPRGNSGSRWRFILVSMRISSRDKHSRSDCHSQMHSVAMGGSSRTRTTKASKTEIKRILWVFRNAISLFGLFLSDHIWFFFFDLNSFPKK